MDFLDPVKKRAHRRRLFLGYFLIGVALLLGSLILLMQAYGYDLDHKTRQVIQNGLIFVDSNPEKSTIYLNGKENGQTDKRLTVPAGQYKLELKRDKYRTWTRSFDLEGSSIERLNYPVLFPEKMDTVDRKLYPTPPQFTTESPDRHWLVIATAVNKLDIYNANNPKETTPKAIEFPKELLTVSKGPESLELVEWSNDNRHLLLRHKFNDSFEYIMLDHEDIASSINISRLLGLNPTTISLRDKKYDQLYLFDSSGSLKLADLKTKAVTNYLDYVISYKSYADNMMLYAQRSTTDLNKTQVKLRDGAKDYLLRTGAKDDQYILDIAQYDGHWYIAVATTGKVFIYRDPMSEVTDIKATPSLFTTLIMDKPSQVLFSTNTRFIMAQSGSKFAIYDAESNRRSYYQLTEAVDPANKAKWMDGYRLTLNQANKVLVFDYDGTNKQVLVSVASGNNALFDRDYTRLYTLTPPAGDTKVNALTLTNLKVIQP